MATLIITLTFTTFLSLILHVFIDIGFWKGMLFLGCLIIPFLVFVVGYIENMGLRGNNG